MDEHCYIISYDLCNPDQKYDELYTLIKSFSKWGHLTQSTWAVVSDLDHVELRDRLMSVLDENDRLIVIKSGGHAAWHNLFANRMWLKENLVK